MSERNNDRSGRWRNRTVAFRVSEEEARQLDMLVSISGLTKQDYITSKLLDCRVTVEPSSRIQRNLAGVMKEVLAELERADPSELTQELQEAIAMLAMVFVGLGEEPREPPLAPALSGRAILRGKRGHVASGGPFRLPASFATAPRSNRCRFA